VPPEILDSEIDSGVATWTMRNPPVNALSPDLAEAFTARLDEALDDESVVCVILTSGLDVFCAGADAKWIAQVVAEHGSAQLLDEFKATLDRFRDIWLRMRRSDVLFIAAVNGHAIAGGLELAAACDLRFAADRDDIQIGASEMKLFGVLPSGGGGTQYLSRMMGPSTALYFLLEAEPCPPRRAMELGLVNRLCSADDLLDDATQFARRIAKRAGRVGTNAAKRIILDASSLRFDEAMELDQEVHWDAMRRGGFLPGIDAFVTRFG
jgi:enoyl-CoA hydratase